MENVCRKRIRIYGIVQGVGFRPTVVRHAKRAGVRGQVANRGSYVEILAEGKEEALGDFLHLVTEEAPERALILKTDVQDLPAEVPLEGDFRIVESQKERGAVFISPDIAICPTCQKELFDRADRRYLHPFINCTLCGPRFSILEALPYDRERTSMKIFPMCPDCAKEYHDRASRRFDAQPVCCPSCGPEVFILGRESLRGGAAITFARKLLAEGKIVAVKGIGGFHLACNAANEEAVGRLRTLKKRPMKPFAVMAKDLSVAKRECTFDEEQEKIMTGPQKPILLLEKKAGGKLAANVSPDNPTVGLMLPYAPVQCLLFSYPDEVEERMPDLLVMTSGNASGAPIASSDEEALAMLSTFCDVLLTNNRDIRIRTDDSVMDFYRGAPYMIRRSRGYAPLPYIMSRPFRGRALGIGGELKNTFCLAVDENFYPSAYVGDLADIRTVRALSDAIGKTESLLEMKPDILCADLHPRYQSSLLAERIAKEEGLPLVKVQHHYAHVLSCMGENDYTDPVLGISFDGTGYGSDGTIWGGEFLLSDLNGFHRLSSIKPFLQVGGDASSREGWRIAVSMLLSLYGERAEEKISRLKLADEKTLRAQKILHDRRMNAVLSTSAGRLFDAVSALLGIRTASTFEGEAATALMYRALQGNGELSPDEICKETFDAAAAPPPEGGAKTEPLATDRLFAWLTEKKLAGEIGTDRLAFLFHANLARMIVQKASALKKETGVSTATLTGGVFQNRLLLAHVEEGLVKEGFTVLRHHLLPPNDGGIALGQALYAMSALETGNF